MHNALFSIANATTQSDFGVPSRFFMFAEHVQTRMDNRFADDTRKRRTLEIICSHGTPERENLVFSIRKPFGVLVEGFQMNENWGSRI
ncbi:MAG: hypothetical protein H7210_12680 [Pyrinomonadaceae bacterium]|nr:hypothetical protein [Phycisphaerales bacterium]